MAPIFITRFKPRTLFAMATFVIGLCMVTIGIFAFLHKFYPNLAYLISFSWMPLAMLIVALIMRAIGIMPVLRALESELFPTGKIISHPVQKEHPTGVGDLRA